MNDKDFDKNIKDLLENFNPTSPSNDWDEFSKMLSQEEGFEDIAFDKIVSDTLKNQRKSFNSLHWILLKNRLEKEAKLRKEVFTTKICESILVLLLVFTFINLDNYLNFDSNKDLDASEYAHHQTLILPELSGVKLINKNPQLPFKRAKIKALENTKIENQTKQFASFVPKVIDKNRTLKSKLPVLDIIKLSNHTSRSNRSIFSTFNGDDKEIVEDTNRKQSEGIEDIRKLKSSLELGYNMDEAYPMFYMQAPELAKKEYAISAILNSNFSIVRSPRDYDFTVDPYRVYNMDFGAGVELSTKSRNAEFSLGVNYTRVAYTPLKISEISGGFNESIVKNTLDKIQFDLVQLPINGRYHFDNERKTHFWAGIGFAANIAFYSDYNIESTVVAPAVSSHPEPETPNESFDRNGSRFDEKNFHPGILEKGSFLDNLFVSANIDLGVETELSDKVSFNASVGYYKALSTFGLGPNNDVLDAMKVGLAIKYKI